MSDANVFVEFESWQNHPSATGNWIAHHFQTRAAQWSKSLIWFLYEPWAVTWMYWVGIALLCLTLNFLVAHAERLCEALYHKLVIVTPPIHSKNVRDAKRMPGLVLRTITQCTRIISHIIHYYTRLRWWITLAVGNPSHTELPSEPPVRSMAEYNPNGTAVRIAAVETSDAIEVGNAIETNDTIEVGNATETNDALGPTTISTQHAAAPPTQSINVTAPSGPAPSARKWWHWWCDDEGICVKIANLPSAKDHAPNAGQSAERADGRGCGDATVASEEHSQGPLETDGTACLHEPTSPSPSSSLSPSVSPPPSPSRPTATIASSPTSLRQPPTARLMYDYSAVRAGMSKEPVVRYVVLAAPTTGCRGKQSRNAALYQSIDCALGLTDANSAAVAAPDEGGLPRHTAYAAALAALAVPVSNDSPIMWTAASRESWDFATELLTSKLVQWAGGAIRNFIVPTPDAVEVPTAASTMERAPSSTAQTTPLAQASRPESTTSDVRTDAKNIAPTGFVAVSEANVVVDVDVTAAAAAATIILDTRANRVPNAIAVPSAIAPNAIAPNRTLYLRKECGTIGHLMTGSRLYEDVAKQLRPFDCIFSRGASGISDAIILVQSQVRENCKLFSHVGYVINTSVYQQEGMVPGEWYVVESAYSGLANYDTTLSVSGRSFSGVQIRSLREQLVAPENRDALYFAAFLEPKARAHVNSLSSYELQRIVSMYLGASYPVNPFNFIGGFIRSDEATSTTHRTTLQSQTSSSPSSPIGARTQAGPVDGRREFLRSLGSAPETEFFCSELVCRTFQLLNLIDEKETDYRFVYPVDFFDTRVVPGLFDRITPVVCE